MKLLTKLLPLFTLIVFLLSACGDSDKESDKSTEKPASEEYTAKYVKGTLPKGLKWLTNEKDPVFSSPNAIKGGTFRASLRSFPQTFRAVGPDSNGGFRSYLDVNKMSLIELHPNTENIIPAIATHWAYGKDKKTMFFKLNKKARWSDGVPVTAKDFLYTLTFMRSKHIVAPWYNDYYTKEIDKVIIYDDHTISISCTKAKPDLHLILSLGPTPSHFYKKLNKGFIKKYNWKVVPNTGPYKITKFKKGKNVIFKRKKEWWAKDLKYNRNRFNVDTVILTVIRDFNLEWEHFKKAKLDTFRMVYPKFWHNKSNTKVFNNGYTHKIWFFIDKRINPQGFYLNSDKEIFKDINVRYAFAHAMNVGKVITQLLRNDYFRLNHAYEGFGKYSNKNIRARKFDIKLVQNYMERSGWKRGKDGIWIKGKMRFSVPVTYSFDGLTERLVVLKEDAKKAGVELILEKYDSSTAFKKILEKKHTVASMNWGTKFRPSYWELYHSDNAHKTQTNNVTNTDDPELDKLINTYRNSIVEKERVELSVKIQQRLHDLCYYVPTMKVPYTRYGYWRWWRLPKTYGTKSVDDLFDPMGNGLAWFDQKVYDETIAAMKSNKKLKVVTIVDKTYKTY